MLFDMVLKREFLGERWLVARENVLAERKCEIIMNLNNMKCCKINKLPEYTISFTKFYYEARKHIISSDTNFLGDLFIT